MRRGLFGSLSPSMEVSTMLRNISIACLSLLLTCSAVRGQDKYYAVVFGYQDRNNRCCEAHTFATFVQVRQALTGSEVVDRATISWLPARGIVKLFKRGERGINHSLEDSLASVKPGCTVAQWGPFEIKEELFHRAKKQAHMLSSGGILYKAVEPFARPAGVAINCEHAICDIALNPGEPHVRTGTAHGHHGSYLVAMHLRSWMIEPGVKHDWLNRPLGLEQHAIAKGGWDYQGPARLEAPSTASAGIPTPATKTASRAAAGGQQASPDGVAAADTKGQRK
jgi:hypothetical protein